MRPRLRWVYARVALRALLQLEALALMAWIAANLVTDPEAVLKALAHRLALHATLGVLALTGSVWAMRGLVRLPALLGRIGPLASSEPVPMLLSVSSDRDEAHPRYTARLTTRDRSRSLSLPVRSVLSPWWLTHSQHETDVFVYSVDEAGPFLVQAPNGEVALIDSKPQP